MFDQGSLILASDDKAYSIIYCMTINHKPNFLSKSIGLIIIMMHLPRLCECKEDHSIISWFIGYSAIATVIKVLLVVLAFILALVTIQYKEEEV